MRIKKLGMLTAAVAAVVLMALAAPGGTAFAEKPYTPRTGDPVRKAVMDGLREWVLENHDIKVIFVVNHLLVADGWAWTETMPQSEDGKQKYEGIAALLRKTARGWQVVHVPSMEEDDPPVDDEYFEGLLEEMPDIPRGIFPWGGKTSGKTSAKASQTATAKSSGEKPYTPKPGNPVRKAVMDGLRGWTKENYSIDVVFVIDHLLVADGWAWTNTRPQSADGKNKYNRVMALLYKTGGGWQVEHAPSLEKGAPPVNDAYFEKLLKEMPGVPRGIFPWGGKQSK